MRGEIVQQYATVAGELWISKTRRELKMRFLDRVVGYLVRAGMWQKLSRDHKGEWEIVGLDSSGYQWAR